MVTLIMGEVPAPEMPLNNNSQATESLYVSMYEKYKESKLIRSLGYLSIYYNQVKRISI